MQSPPISIRALGEFFVGAGAFALLVSLFLPWYEFPRIVIQEFAPSPSLSANTTAWEAFNFADVLLAGIAAVAIPAVWLERSSAQGWIYGALALLGWFAAAGIVYSYFRPAAIGVVGPYPGPPAIGYFGGLCGSGGILVGGLLAAFGSRAD